MKRYDLSKLFKKAWNLYRAALKKGTATFADALKTAWAWLKVQAANAAKVEAKAAELGIDEEVNTWAGWKAVGRMVMHTSKAVFQVEVAAPETKKGTRINSYFLYSDTQHAPQA